MWDFEQDCRHTSHTLNLVEVAEAAMKRDKNETRSVCESEHFRYMIDLDLGRNGCVQHHNSQGGEWSGPLRSREQGSKGARERGSGGAGQRLRVERLKKEIRPIDSDRPPRRTIFAQEDITNGNEAGGSREQGYEGPREPQRGSRRSKS